MTDELRTDLLALVERYAYLSEQWALSASEILSDPQRVEQYHRWRGRALAFKFAAEELESTLKAHGVAD